MRSRDVGRGIAFEKWVADLYNDLGKKQVNHNVIYTLKDDESIKAQIDVTYGKKKPYLVECKYRKQGQAVTFSDVATFAAKLELLDIHYKKGIMITNSVYEPRARVYGEKIKLTLYDHEDVKRLDRKRQGMFRKMFSRQKYDLNSMLKQYQQVGA
ncbi:MAG: restriction endonuclease [Nanobdellota archaeon]